MMRRDVGSLNSISSGGFPTNYVTQISAPGITDSTTLEINSIKLNYFSGGPYTARELETMSKEWKKFFVIKTNPESQMGVISLTHDRTDFITLFNVKTSIEHLISKLKLYTKRDDLPMPDEFVLEIVKNTQGQKSVLMELPVKLPPFGDKNCDLLDWDHNTGDWRESDIAKLRNATCQHVGYEIMPQGIEFTTTQEDIDNLPGWTHSEIKKTIELFLKTNSWRRVVLKS